jgi:hypothetical protein
MSRRRLFIYYKFVDISTSDWQKINPDAKSHTLIAPGLA